ncbi:MAG: Tfx family DNA-binding protein [Candidatus Bathyarchaeia archaeon]
MISLGKHKRLHLAHLQFNHVGNRLTRLKAPATLLTQRQWQVMRLRATGLTQREVAKRLRTTRENVSIIEHRAHRNLRTAKATLATLEQLSESRELIIPTGTSIFEATSMILLRADVLRIKVKMSADSILAAIRSKCKGRIRRHHLTAVVKIRISEDGAIIIK